jgi:hypothetical protein
MTTMPLKAEHDPEEPAPDLIRGGSVSENIMLH